MSQLEIEKRYLCHAKELKKFLKKSQINYIIQNIEQFYLIAKPGETLRYRKDSNRYFKNQKRGSGLIRQEKEEEISKKEYLKAKAKNSGGVIKKDRYRFLIDNNLYELDIFKGTLKGLSILEIEFSDIYNANNYKIPQVLEPFIIKDITNENIYSNAALSRSMKIPLRSDSKLSLNEIKRDKKRLLKPKLDLYISDYENSKDAFLNSINRLLLSYDENLNLFLNNNRIKNLKRANNALIKIKALIIGHKQYIKKDSYTDILFNINHLILIFEKPLKLNITFKTLLDKKTKLPINKQTTILKELLNLAKEEKSARESIKLNNINAPSKELKKAINNIKFKNIEKPFIYLKDKTTKKLKKEVKNALKCNILELIYLALKNYKTINKYFKKQFKYKKEYKKLKYEYKIDICTNYSIFCKSKNNTIIKKLKKEFNGN